MKWASVLSREQSPKFAVQAASESLAAQLGDESPDLIFVFVYPHRSDQYPLIPAALAEQFPSALVVGCSAGGGGGGGAEVERSPALSLTAAVLPNVKIVPFHLESAEAAVFENSPSLWQQRLGMAPEDRPCLVVIPDPYTCDANALIHSLDDAFPASRKVGGLASGGRAPGDNALFLKDKIYPTGAVGVALCGDLTMDTIVAQGCRPIGTPLFITWAEQNLILQLEGRKATDVLVELFESLPSEDQELFQHSLFLGIVMREGQEVYEQGDLLIRNLQGMDPDAGVLAVGEHLSKGQVVQFHLRDAKTSAHDLDEMLGRYKREIAGPYPEGALIFSCLGRGQHLYGEADHDSRVIQAQLGELPIGGFFCNGEIGPVGGRSFLHGYTSSIALFRTRLSH